MMRGNNAAIAPVTVQAAAKAKASSTMVRSIECGFVALATAAFAPATGGSISQADGVSIRICAAAQAKQVLRQPMLQPERRQRPADGGGKAREQRDAGNRAAARRLAMEQADAPKAAS